MKPSVKSTEMEIALTGMFGFDRRTLIEANKCCPPPIGCGKDVTDFRDELSRREYTISGLCQLCQDSIFTEPANEHVERKLEAANRARRTAPNRYVAKPDEFVTDDYQMFSGAAEASKQRYHKHVGKSGRIWLVADSDYAAESIYVANNKENTTSRAQDFEGFGGSTLTFELVNGTTCALRGPWHTNSSALLTDTGVDVRDCHRTFVVLSKEMESANDGTMRRVFRRIVYQDTAPTLGRYDRYKDLIRQHPEAIYYYASSRGGSSSGMISESDRR